MKKNRIDMNKNKKQQSGKKHSKTFGTFHKINLKKNSTKTIKNLA